MGRRQILIVEDDEEYHFIYKRMLSGSYLVHVARNVRAASHILLEYSIDLILLDLHLKDEVSGTELIHFSSVIGCEFPSSQ